jgi:hypothetical protein
MARCTKLKFRHPGRDKIHTGIGAIKDALTIGGIGRR